MAIDFLYLKPLWNGCGVSVGCSWTISAVWVKAIVHADGKTDARYFERPDEFIPERWTSKPHLVRRSAAFFPFSLGEFAVSAFWV